MRNKIPIFLFLILLNIWVFGTCPGVAEESLKSTPEMVSLYLVIRAGWNVP